MPTIFERINSTLAENDVSVRVNVQAGNLTNVANLITEMIENPPDSLGDLSTALQALPLPDLGISPAFAQALNALKAAVPSNLSSITGGMTDDLGALQGQLGSLTEPLERVLEVVLAIYNTTQVDLFCAPSGGGAPAGDTPLPLKQLNTFLDLFPEPLTLDSLLHWLYLRLRDFDLSAFHIPQFPILDDLRDPLVTLFTWRDAMSTAQLLAHMNNSLTLLGTSISGTVDAVFTPIEIAMNAVIVGLPTVTLAQIADEMVTHLGTLRIAIASGDLSTTTPAITALNALLDSYNVIRLNVQNNLSLAFSTLADRLGSLDVDLDDQINQLMALLQPESLLHFIPTPPTLTLVGLGDFENWLDTLVEWIGELTDRLDLSAIQTPLNTVAEVLQNAVNALDAGMITVTLQVQSLFGELENLLDPINPAALLAEIQAGIDDFRAIVASQLQSLFAPIRQAISNVIGEIAAGIESFDPAEIINALKDALARLTDVLKHPDVLSAMNSIREAIQNTAAALESVSFAPLADQVITEIDALTAAFQELDVSTLSTPVQLSLQGALLILPDDLTPISDPLLAQLGQVVVEGPLPLLQTLSQQPQILLNQIRAFEPGRLLGDALSAPYQNLLAQMNSFKPSILLNQAAAELDTLKTRLRENASPGQLLLPLQAPYDDLMEAFDQLNPQAVVAPLETAIQNAISAVVEILPVDETFDQLDAVLGPIERAAQVGTDTISLLQRIVSMLNGLANPRAQMDAWIAAILTNVNDIIDIGPLQPAFDTLEDALEETNAASLLARFETTSIESALIALNPQGRLVALIQAYNSLPRSQLEALPNSPEKTAILAVLNRFNPIDPAFVPPYQRAAELQSALAAVRSRLGALLSDWENKHEASALAALRGLQATPESLRAWIGEALEDRIGRPIVAALSLVAPLVEVLGALVSKLQALVTALTGKLNSLLQGPGSLGAIRTSIQALLDQLQNFNLDFLTQSIGGVFSSLRGKLQTINPAALRTSIDAAFTAMLDTLRIDLLIPAAQIAQLDAAYQNVLDDLKALDPGKLVVEVVQPEFEANVVPLLEVFDPTEVLNALTAKLAGIEEELRAEIARVNEAYQRLLDSIPSISISLDVDVELPF
jgi:hypothetical protein